MENKITIIELPILGAKLIPYVHVGTWEETFKTENVATLTWKDGK